MGVASEFKRKVRQIRVGVVTEKMNNRFVFIYLKIGSLAKCSGASLQADVHKHPNHPKSTNNLYITGAPLSP